jgi:ABC-type phosphate/phosphonate transport system substrate-binding protein
MIRSSLFLLLFRRNLIVFGLGLLSLLAIDALSAQQKPKTLHIGASGSLALNESKEREDTAMKMLHDFIQSETGFENEIVTERNYEELAQKMAAGKLELGVFQGYEYAWAKEKYPKLQPLAIAVNIYPYRHAIIMVRQDSKATKFTDLAGQALAEPQAGLGHLPLFLARQVQVGGGNLDKYFSKLTHPGSIEEALDDVVDGNVQAAVVDRVGLESYKRRKPGRFAQLKELMRSDALPPPLIAVYDQALDQPTLNKFQDSVINARKKEKGQRLLTLFKLTGFSKLPADFDKVVAQTRKAYPPPNLKVSE